MDTNVKEYTFQVAIDRLEFRYERPNDHKCLPTVYIIGDVISHDGYTQKCDIILPGMQRRFLMIIAKLYEDGFDGDILESYFEAITILFDEIRLAYDAPS